MRHALQGLNSLFVYLDDIVFESFSEEDFEDFVVAYVTLDFYQTGIISVWCENY